MRMQVAIMIGIKLSIFLIVFSLGLGASIGDRSFIQRNSKLILRSILSMNIFMPILAVVIAEVFNFSPAVKIALIALSVSPVPPILPRKELKEGGTEQYAFGLLITAAVLSIVLVPISMSLIGNFVAREIHVPPMNIAKLVSMTILIPLGLGVLVRNYAAAFASKIKDPVSKIAPIILLVCVVPLLISVWPMIRSLIGDGALIAMALFSLIGLVIGNSLGGPIEEDRTVLAMSTASRHPGISIAIGAIIAPQDKSIVAAVLLYLIVNTVISSLYLAWKRRSKQVAITT